MADQNHVKTGTHVAKTVAILIHMGGTNDAPLLTQRRHPFARIVEFTAPTPTFHFDKDYGVFASCNQVNFSVLPAPVALQDLKSQINQPRFSNLLASSTGAGAAFQNHVTTFVSDVMSPT